MMIKFSCDNDETTENGYEIIKDASICENDESTSWAFVASKESTQKMSNTALPSSKKVSASNPALIVEIIEKEKVEDQVDEDGYKVVMKTKQKQRPRGGEQARPRPSINQNWRDLSRVTETVGPSPVKDIAETTEDDIGYSSDNNEVIDSKEWKQLVDRTVAMVFEDV